MLTCCIRLSRLCKSNLTKAFFHARIRKASWYTSTPPIAYYQHTASYRQGLAVAKKDTGFLNLPRELRDMVYIYICDDMKRTGALWYMTAQPPPPSTGQYRSDPDRQIFWYQSEDAYHNCSTMRTCKQLHWEFAEMMYARPLQFSSITPCAHTIPISAIYAHFIRKALIVHAIYALHYRPHICQGVRNNSGDVALGPTDSHRINKALSARKRCAGGLATEYRDGRHVESQGDIAQIEQVRVAEKFIRMFCSGGWGRTKIPKQQEFVRASSWRPTIHEVTPLVETWRNVCEADVKKQSA
jgi:hypothetical protein